ncbi:MAG: prolyl-tRNA synthetase associated domain-containing protein [Erysipelotrichaceae bacterium]|nr:prolyl-tRNA synthetase associated domain-containing protein [Erysipelotrichaceae bacterium]
MLNKEDIINLLKEKKIPFEVVEHKAVFTVEEAEELKLPHPEAGAKNLFLRDDKKRNYYLISCRDNLKVDIKNIQLKLNSRRLSFASEEDLMKIMGLIRGAVTPFGILNDERRMVRMVFDDYFKDHLISVHPNDNKATLYINGKDLYDVLNEHGNEIIYLNME